VAGSCEHGNETLGSKKKKHWSTHHKKAFYVLLITIRQWNEKLLIYYSNSKVMKVHQNCNYIHIYHVLEYTTITVLHSMDPLSVASSI
jgi:hypothetical protein